MIEKYKKAANYIYSIASDAEIALVLSSVLVAMKSV